MKTIIIATYPLYDPPYDVPCGVYANDDIKIAIIRSENDKWVICNLDGERLPDTEEYGLIENACFKIVDLVSKKQLPFYNDFGAVETIDGKRLVRILVLAETTPSPD